MSSDETTKKGKPRKFLIGVGSTKITSASTCQQSQSHSNFFDQQKHQRSPHRQQQLRDVTRGRVACWCCGQQLVLGNVVGDTVAPSCTEKCNQRMPEFYDHASPLTSSGFQGRIIDLQNTHKKMRLRILNCS